MVVVAVALAAMLVASATVFAGSDPGREMEQKYGVVSDPGMVSLVGGVVANVSRAAKMRNYDCKILGAKDLNAFALSDGRIYITEGMVSALDRNPDSIAFVLGHEITHVVQRHSAGQTKGNLLGMAFGWIFAELLGAKSDAARENYIGIGGELVGAKYSRNDEYKADEGGFKFAVAAGYSPQGGPTAMRLLLNKYGKGDAGLPVVGWFASHPDTNARLVKLDKLAGTATTVAGISGTTTARSLAGGPTINPRQKGMIPNIRVVVTQSTVEGDGYPNDLPSRVKSNVENGLWQAGIPIYGRGQSLDDTRREKNLEDADPRTQVEKKGVHMATANVELKTIVEKTNTRLGFTYRLTNYGDIQIGDQVEIKIRTESKSVNTETTEIALMSTAGARRKRIESITVYVQQWGNGLYLDIRGQVEQMIREAVDEASQKMVEQIVRQVDRIPSQDGPGLAPVIRTAPTTLAPTATTASQAGKYFAWERKNHNVVAVYFGNDVIWQNANEAEKGALDGDKHREVDPKFVQILYDIRPEFRVIR